MRVCADKVYFTINTEVSLSDNYFIMLVFWMFEEYIINSTESLVK